MYPKLESQEFIFLMLLRPFVLAAAARIAVTRLLR